MAKLDWDSFDRFEDIYNKYLPASGEGETKATQVTTAICKLVYKWFNDGDVFDNTYNLEGWANDLSSYANWLYTYIPETKLILDRIKTIETEDEYTELLYDLADSILTNSNLEKLDKEKSIDSIYEADGPFEFGYENEDESE